MSLPPGLVRVAEMLVDGAGEQEAFLTAVREKRADSIRALVLGQSVEGEFSGLPVPFDGLPEFIHCVSSEESPGKLSQHERGEIYVLDVSSVVLPLLLQEVPREPKVALDICASPGGKSLFVQRFLQPEILLCNEYERKRAGVLASNLSRCYDSFFRASKTHKELALFQGDVSLLNQVAPEAVDLLVADVPCSGQSLYAKGQRPQASFNPATIKMNVRRQRGILGNVPSLVAPGGYFLYLTCTYNVKENERQVEWFVKNYPEFIPRESTLLRSFRSHHASMPCYRIYPHQGLGAGGFGALFQRQGDPSKRGKLSLDAHPARWEVFQS